MKCWKLCMTRRIIIPGCCCNNIYKERVTPDYYHSIFPPFVWKLNLVIFGHLRLLMGDPLIPPLLLLTKILSLGAVAMKSTTKKVLQAITAPFSCHFLKMCNYYVFWQFWADLLIVNRQMDRQMDGQVDRQMDGRTEKPSYRYWRMNLKTEKQKNKKVKEGLSMELTKWPEMSSINKKSAPRRLNLLI